MLMHYKKIIHLHLRTSDERPRRRKICDDGIYGDEDIGVLNIRRN